MIYPRLPARLLGGIWILLILLGGCGNNTTNLLPLATTNEDEAAIYTAIIAYMGADTINPKTTHGIWHFDKTDDQPVDCAKFQTSLMRDMPEIVPDLAFDFCTCNETIRPVNPEIIWLLSLDIGDWETTVMQSVMRVSTMQIDPTKRQVLIFVEVRDGDFSQGVYLLLTDEDGTWRVRDESQVYIS